MLQRNNKSGQERVGSIKDSKEKGIKNKTGSNTSKEA